MPVTKLTGSWSERRGSSAVFLGVVAAAALLVSAPASYAASPLTVDGNFTLTYTPSSGQAPGDMSFSSSPQDGKVTTGPGVGFDLGSNTMSGQSVSANPFYLDGASHSGQEGVLPQLTVGNPITLNFFTANPAGSCITSTSPHYTCANNTAIGTITATFSFTTPSGATGNMTDTATYSANYGGTLACTAPDSDNPADCVVWSTSNDPITVNFSDGARLQVTMNNAHDWAITPTITFNLTQGPSSVPEPASIALFGSAVAGLGLIRRRRKAA